MAERKTLARPYAKAVFGLARENGKLELLPEISALFNQRRAEVEGTVSAEVISAYELDDSQIEALAGALKNELKRDVVIETSVDSSIIGGVIIRAGDTVIDGSVAGKLKDLTSYLTR